MAMSIILPNKNKQDSLKITLFLEEIALGVLDN